MLSQMGMSAQYQLAISEAATTISTPPRYPNASTMREP